MQENLWPTLCSEIISLGFLALYLFGGKIVEVSHNVFSCFFTVLNFLTFSIFFGSVQFGYGSVTVRTVPANRTEPRTEPNRTRTDNRLFQKLG